MGAQAGSPAVICVQNEILFNALFTFLNATRFVGFLDNRKMGKYFLKCGLFLQNMNLDKATRSVRHEKIEKINSVFV